MHADFTRWPGDNFSSWQKKKKKKVQQLGEKKSAAVGCKKKKKKKKSSWKKKKKKKKKKKSAAVWGKKKKVFRMSVSKTGKLLSFSVIFIFFHSVDNVSKRCSQRENTRDHGIQAQ